MIRRILLVAVMIALLTGSAAAMDPEGCNECHGLKLVKRYGESFESLEVLESGFRNSTHASLYCSDCHIKNTSIPHEAGSSETICFEKCHAESGVEETRKRHAEKYYSYQDDVHFKKGIGCAGCHSEFGRVGAFGMSLKCLTCHVGKGSGEGSLLLSTPVHGDLTGLSGVVSCSDCHSPHVRGDEREPKKLNCYRGAECHGEKVVKKISVGGHFSSGGGKIFLVSREVVRGFVLVTVVLGVGLVWVRSGVDEE